MAGGVAGQSCGNCEFYVYGVRTGTQECHFNPPTLVSGHGYWPAIQPTEWCGNWKVQASEKTEELSKVQVSTNTMGKKEAA